MGRPPIGKHAMSGAERQRRYLERLLRGSKSAASGAGTEELARAKARIAELEHELAQARTTAVPDGTATGLRKQLAQAKAEIKELKGALKSAAVQRRRQLIAAPKGCVFISKAGRKKILMALDPSKQQDPGVKKMHAEALQIFETLPLREIET